jgi:DNA-binding protein H-NS
MHQLAASAIGPLLCALDPGRNLDRMTKKAREANPITRRKPAYFEVRLSQKADQLQDQLSRLGGEIGSKTRRGRSSLKGRRVAIKYRDRSGNTWAGRGAQPAWLREKLKAGAKLEDFAVQKTAASRKASPRKSKKRRKAKR